MSSSNFKSRRQRSRKRMKQTVISKWTSLKTLRVKNQWLSRSSKSNSTNHILLHRNKHGTCLQLSMKFMFSVKQVYNRSRFNQPITSQAPPRLTCHRQQTQLTIDPYFKTTLQQHHLLIWCHSLAPSQRRILTAHSSLYTSLIVWIKCNLQRQIKWVLTFLHLYLIKSLLTFNYKASLSLTNQGLSARKTWFLQM